MGHSAGRLFLHDHVVVQYADVMTMTSAQREYVRESGETTSNFALPDDSLVILSRYEEQFEFLNCREDDNPPVMYFNHWDWEIVQSHVSVSEWLETWFREAQDCLSDNQEAE